MLQVRLLEGGCVPLRSTASLEWSSRYLLPGLLPAEREAMARAVGALGPEGDQPTLVVSVNPLYTPSSERLGEILLHAAQRTLDTFSTGLAVRRMAYTQACKSLGAGGGLPRFKIPVS